MDSMTQGGGVKNHMALILIAELHLPVCSTTQSCLVAVFEADIGRSQKLSHSSGKHTETMNRHISRLYFSRWTFRLNSGTQEAHRGKMSITSLAEHCLFKIEF